MISFPTPTPLDGGLLKDQLATAGLHTDVLVRDASLVLPDLGASDQAAAQKVVDAHPATAQAALDTAAAGQANETSIRDKAAAALDTNKTFLALTSPTNAQVAAQVKALTRQNNGLIRLALRRFDAAD